jgi:hypothetical protein
MAGDEYLSEEPSGRRKVVFTRAVDIAEAPRRVWPWLSQLGRGAGFYSYDRLDNGGRISARHIVSWIPDPRLGDASAIGYLRHIEVGKELVWWMPGLRWLGSWVRMVVDVLLTPSGSGSRLVIRISGDAEGWSSFLILNVVFVLIDTIMARRQLVNIKARVERHGRDAEPIDPETGARDQYQFYEALFASGEGAGVPGKESAAEWRKAALAELGGSRIS